MIRSVFLSAVFLIFLSCKKDPIRKPDPTPQPTLSAVLISHFSLNEGAGSVLKDSKTGASLNLVGRGLNWIEGLDGNSFYFDGLSNNAEGEIDTNILPSEKLIISAWIAPKTYPIGDAGIISFTSPDSSTGIQLMINKYGQLKFQYFIEGAYAQIVTNSIVERARWSHVLVSLNTKDRKIELYLNGNKEISANVPSGKISWKSGKSPLKLGRSGITQKIGIFDVDYYSGAIDEIQIFSGSLEPSLLDSLYSSYNSNKELDYVLNNDYSSDLSRPIYHPIPDAGWANESYGLIEHQGKYHMFFQKNEVFLGIAQQNWGHFESLDLVHWIEKQPVLWPSQSFDSAGTWSGSSIIVDETPYIIYTGVDGAKAGIGSASSSNGYKTLDKNISNPLISRAPTQDVDMDFRDPFVWYENDTYYMIIGSGKSNEGGNILLYTSTDFNSWDYVGIAYQGQKGEGEGSFWEMPVLVKFSNDRYALVVQNTPEGTPARTMYWIGSFNGEKFIPNHQEPKYLELINGFLSPTVMKDSNGKILSIGIIPDEVNGEHQRIKGWANLFSVAQEWNLNANDIIEIKPYQGLNELRDSEVNFNSLIISESESDYLDDLGSFHYQLDVNINLNGASEFGLVIGKTPDNEEYVTIGYKPIESLWFIDTRNSSLSDLVRRDYREGVVELDNPQSLKLQVFVDGSVIEVFIDDKYHFTGRYYPTFQNATGIDLFTKGGEASVDLNYYPIN